MTAVRKVRLPRPPKLVRREDVPIVDPTGQVIGVTLTLPIKLVSVANLREHWSVKHKRVAAERLTAKLAVLAATKTCRGALSDGIVVTITRLGPRRLDTDNLSSAGKGCRDGIADALGVDDGDDFVEWRYAQECPSPYGVRVRVEPREKQC